MYWQVIKGDKYTGILETTYLEKHTQRGTFELPSVVRLVNMLYTNIAITHFHQGSTQDNSPEQHTQRGIGNFWTCMCSQIKENFKQAQ